MDIELIKTKILLLNFFYRIYQNINFIPMTMNQMNQIYLVLEQRFNRERDSDLKNTISILLTNLEKAYHTYKTQKPFTTFKYNSFIEWMKNQKISTRDRTIIIFHDEKIEELKKLNINYYYMITVIINNKHSHQNILFAYVLLEYAKKYLIQKLKNLFRHSSQTLNYIVIYEYKKDNLHFHFFIYNDIKKSFLIKIINNLSNQNKDINIHLKQLSIKDYDFNYSSLEYNYQNKIGSINEETNIVVQYAIMKFLGQKFISNSRLKISLDIVIPIPI